MSIGPIFCRQTSICPSDVCIRLKKRKGKNKDISSTDSTRREAET